VKLGGGGPVQDAAQAVGHHRPVIGMHEIQPGRPAQILRLMLENRPVIGAQVGDVQIRRELAHEIVGILHQGVEPLLGRLEGKLGLARRLRRALTAGIQFALIAQMHPQAGDELLVIEGLGDVVNRPGLKGFQLGGEGQVTRQENHRDVPKIFLRMDDLEQRHAVHVRQRHVEQDELDRLAAQQG